ncbi:hypothetical protein AKJ42_03605, partial [candidate division MSBL1 archaeon SCGC-AAA261C02]
KESTRILEKIRRHIQRKLKSKIGGWGVHGIKSDVTERDSPNICHHREFSISSFPEIDELRKTLRSVREAGLETVEESAGEIHDVARDKLDDLVPFEIKPKSLEGYLAFFACLRKPRGAFENQFHRFIYENYRGKTIRKKDIRDALLRLEVHGYLIVTRTPRDLRRKLEGSGIRRSRRFYEVGIREPPEEQLFQRLNKKVDIGAYLDPLPRRRLVKSLDAPDHIVNKSIKKLERKGILSERRVFNCLGRTVRKIKPKRRPKRLSGLDRRIVEKADHHYEVQKNALDQMQERS